MFPRAARVGWLLVAFVVLGGSAASGDPPTVRNRLFYIGLALYSEPWSENDVVELARRLREASKFEVVPMIASNLTSRPRRYPVADDAAITGFVTKAAALTRAHDVILVAISSHGSPKLLARKMGRREPTALTSHELARMLAPLAPHRTVIIISACYSGSLIEELRAPRRIIITAARADRTSFGCSADSRHTFFGQAELKAFAQSDRSLRQVVAAIREDVARREREQRRTPSEPQVSVGAEMGELYDAPVF